MAKSLREACPNPYSGAEARVDMCCAPNIDRGPVLFLEPLRGKELSSLMISIAMMITMLDSSPDARAVVRMK